MRILFDQSAHDMRNKGNNALLEAAMQVLGGFWPTASLEVITSAPNLLRLLYPNTEPVSPDTLYKYQSRFERVQYLLPSSIWWILFEIREEIWHRHYARISGVAHEQSVALAQISSEEVKSQTFEKINPAEKTELGRALSHFDLFVASGGGYLCDNDKPMLWKVFDRLEACVANGIPTVMVGQGIGPLKDSQLLARAREILPSVDLILYRNHRNGLPILESLGVSPARILMTGDDAIEAAYNARPKDLGNGIGVSLRVANYTQVESRHLDSVRRVLHQVAAAHRAELIAVPISSARHESDITHIKRILKGYNAVSLPWRKLGPPMDAIRQAGRCRVMVTGTYHGAIFSLAQGIPVVGVARSAEYVNKLAELSEEFPDGIRMVHLNDDRLEFNLHEAIEDAWLTAEEARPSILKDALRLITLQHQAYKHLYEYVSLKMKR